MTSMNEHTASELLTKAITEPGSISAAYTAFHGYSLGNRMLAWAQCINRGIPLGPIATFMSWKDKGRFVKKGAKAIVLCMPITGKRTEDTPEGTEEHTFTRFVYKPHWFVLVQTDGEPLAPLTLPEWSTARALETLQITEESFTGLDGNSQGYAYEHTISVSPVAAMPHKTRFHELAHVVLGHTSEGRINDDDRTPRNLREIEAESVALLCCEALNLPGAEFSRGYIQHWNQSGEAIPERSAQKIFKAADQILNAGHPAESEKA